MRFLLSIIPCILPLLSWGQSSMEKHIPFRDIEATDSGIVVTYTFCGGIHQPDPLHDGAKSWKIPGFGMNDNAGEPGFPFRWDTFIVPDNAEVHVTLLDSAYIDTLFTIAPAYPPLLNSDTIGYTPDRVPAINPRMGFYPNTSVKKGDIQSYRGQGLVRVATLPVQYNCQTGIVRAFSRIKYLVSFTEKNTRSKIMGRKYVSESADSRISFSDNFLDNTTLNYKLSTNGRKNIHKRSGENQTQPDNRDYLIISTPKYAEAVNRFAEWKRTKGFRTHVLLRNDWTVTSVKTSIMELYNTEGVNLYYLLIVGGLNDVPAYRNKPYLLYDHVTDYYYGCMEDTIMVDESRDILPIIHRGRITATSLNEATTIINKIIGYEVDPPLDSLFFNTGIHCSYFEDEIKKVYNTITHQIEALPPDGCEDGRLVLTSEDIKNYVEGKGKTIKRIYYAKPATIPLRWNNGFYANGDSIPQELRKPTFSWNGNYNDIINTINDKAFYVLYTGHGERTAWLDPIYLTSHIGMMNNTQYLPVVFSMSCNTGNYISSNSFAECFLKKEMGGCVGIFAASERAHKGYTDTLSEGFFNSIWPNPGLYYFFRTNNANLDSISNTPVYALGDILDTGFNYLRQLETISSDTIEINLNVYNRELFHLFGDPSMMIYTNPPLTISNPTINVNNNTISIQLTDGNARISFYVPGTTPVVDSYIGNSVDYTTFADSVIICIDRHNYIPHIVTYHKNEYIQNESINNTMTYVGKIIKIGRNVTTTKPEGDVIINGANVIFNGGNVECHPGTTIINSNIIINPQ